MEQLRKALGDEQLTYLGFSYGTALGAVYANLFPDRPVPRCSTAASTPTPVPTTSTAPR